MKFIFAGVGAACFVAMILFAFNASAQEDVKTERNGEFYFSWGYNTEWYTNSTIYIDQPSLNNDYNFESIKAHDRRGWDQQFFFNTPISIPQYNYRFGYFFNKEKGLGIELNYDHTKYIVADGQQAHIKGTVNGQYADAVITFSGANGFVYALNNGANFFLFNFVKRWHVMKAKNEKEKLKVDVLGKAGIGPLVPHVQDTFFGDQNTPHFQLGGWDTGVEGDIRITFFKYAYLEYANKLDYARYSGLRIYEGTAKQAFGTYEMIANIGVTFPIGKKVEQVKQ